MSFLICDVGSYSFKYALIKIIRKSYHIDSFEEVIFPKNIFDKNLDDNVDQVEFSFHENYQKRLEYFLEYLKNNNFIDLKIYLNFPDNYLTSRYITLPIENKKKAIQMLPFQLDEQLPQSLDSQHFSTFIKAHSKSSSTITQIVNKKTFSNIYNIFEKFSIFPQNLSSNLFYFNSNTNNQIKNGAIADIGHNYTHFYCIKNSVIIADQTFHFGGKLITEMISQVYNISTDEALIFKHRNSFFLTSLQFSDVDEDQQEFAKLMNKISQPLVMEINRWRLSIRVNHGFSIENFYLVGGTSKIKNISEYLEEETGVKFESLTQDTSSTKLNWNLGNQAQAIISKTKAPSLLTGNYSTKNNDTLPWESLLFTFSRGLIFASFVLMIIIIDTFLITKPENKRVKKQLTKIIKRTTVPINRKDKLLLRRRPLLFQKKLVNKIKKAKLKNSKISITIETTPLEILNSMSKSINVLGQTHLDKFVTDGISVKAYFKSKDLGELDKLKIDIEQNSFKSTKIRLDKNTKSLSLQYRL